MVEGVWGVWGVWGVRGVWEVWEEIKKYIFSPLQCRTTLICRDVPYSNPK